MRILPLGISRKAVPAPVPVLKASRPLHRLGVVRRLQETSRRTLARHLNTDVAHIKQQEEPTSDILLSDLYKWQWVLDVPAVELLQETDGVLTAQILKRAQLVRLMKTILAICEESNEEPIRHTARTLAGQLLEIMPELKMVNAWHTVGKRRRRDEYGAAAERRLSQDALLDLGRYG